MYLSHYNLKEKPFQISTDPKFLWLGEKHKEALAILKYGIIDNKGFLLLTGDVGTGKTTLINALLNSLGEETIVAKVFDPGLETLDFFNFVANSFEMERKFESKGEFLIHLDRFLHNAHSENKKVLLIIDEAQRLKPELLEEIRLLSNIEKQKMKLLNIFFVGQNEFNEILSRAENRALRQRITLNHDIDPLTENETEEYIRYRLRVAGCENPIFDFMALHEIFSFSRGYPRLINIICDLGLLSGYVKGKKTIGDEIIKECAEELQIPIQNRSSDASNPPPSEGLKRKTLENSRKRFAGWVTGFTAMLIMLLLAGGYMHFMEVRKENAYQKENPTAQKFKVFDREEDEPESLKMKKEKKDDSGYPLENRSSQSIKENLPANATLFSEKNANRSLNGEQNAPFETENPSALPGEKIIIRFSRNSNEILPEGFDILNRIAGIMKLNPAAEILIKGYTDSSGDTVYNRRLSGFRANIAKSYLVGKGISPLKIETIGLGPAEPLESNDTIEGRTLNRRVEIEFKINRQR
jgi:general secretion pathway protein A